MGEEEELSNISGNLVEDEEECYFLFFRNFGITHNNYNYYCN